MSAERMVYVSASREAALAAAGMTALEAIDYALRAKGFMPEPLPRYCDALPSYPPGKTIQELMAEYPKASHGAIQWALTSDPRVARARCTEPRGRAKGRPPWRYWIPSDVAPVAPPAQRDIGAEVAEGLAELRASRETSQG